MPSPLYLGDTLGQFGIRVVQEAMATALPSVWEKRGAELEAARPKPGDFNGNATAADLAERDARLAEQAAACRRHSAFLLAHPHDVVNAMSEDVRALMSQEVS